MESIAEQVLFVDDEVNILRTLQRLFLDEDYEMFTAESGQEALLMIDEGLAPQVIVSDQRMPGMDGSEFLSKVREKLPDSVRIILTGYADITAAVDAINLGEVFRYILKPWEDEELKRTIRDGFEHYWLRHQNKALMEELRRVNKEINELNITLEKKVDERTRDLKKSYDANLVLTAELRHKVKELEGWDRMQNLLLIIHPLDEVLKVFCDVVCSVTPNDGVRIYLYDDQTLGIAHSCQIDQSLAGIDTLYPAIDVQGIVEQREGRWFSGDALPEQCRDSMKSIALIPLCRKESVVGMLEVFRAQGSFDENNMKTLFNFGAQAARAISEANVDTVLPELESSIDSILQEFKQE